MHGSRWTWLKYLVALVGVGLGLSYAINGLLALFVSRGSIIDWVSILSVFFVTLPASVLGVFKPRLAALAMIGLGALATVAIAAQDTEALPRLILLYTGPSILVGVGLLISAVGPHRSAPSEAPKVFDSHVPSE
jgi:hypothetical protein